MNTMIVNTTGVYILLGVIATIVSRFVPAARSDQGYAHTRAARTGEDAVRSARRQRPAGLGAALSLSRSPACAHPSPRHRSPQAHQPAHLAHRHLLLAPVDHHLHDAAQSARGAYSDC